MGALEDRVALVTGGSSGIGRACARAFAAEGATIIVGDVSVEDGEETARLIERAGGRAAFIRVDVTKASDVAALVRRGVETFGRLDCAHNNAGISGTVAPTAECTEENWDRTIAINLKGVWLCMKYEIRQMLEQGGGGVIVNTAAGAGLAGLAGLPSYVASKHGVIGLTRSAALEYARAGIRVNAVCPGTTATPMVERLSTSNAEAMAEILSTVPVGRMAAPEEIAAAVVWLCSEAASFVTGHAMVVDGGALAG